jgi:hypothetical protein
VCFVQQRNHEFFVYSEERSPEILHSLNGRVGSFGGGGGGGGLLILHRSYH